MMKNNLLEKHLDSALSDITPSAAQRGRLRRYSRDGGTESKNPWYTTGLVLSRPDDTSLICEAFLLVSQDVCVLRVYCDSPLQITHAVKCKTSSPVFKDVLNATTRAYAEAVAQSPVCGLNELDEMMDEDSLPKELEEAFAVSLFPIPPPINLEAIPDAEQSPGHVR